MEINYGAVGNIGLCEQIAQQLEQMILSDSPQVGQKLPSEQSLAAGYGVSRSVIREALTFLKARGLISQRQGDGAYVTVPESDQVEDTVNRMVRMRQISFHDVFAVRVNMEVMAIRLAAEYADEAGLQKLHAINKKMFMEQLDTVRRIDLDLEFHRCIASLSGNSMLEIFIQSMNPLLRPMLELGLSVPNANEDGIQYHQSLIDTITRHDPDRAEQTIRKHLSLSMRNYEVAMREQVQAREA